jgi:hypothetical protein
MVQDKFTLWIKHHLKELHANNVHLIQEPKTKIQSAYQMHANITKLCLVMVLAIHVCFLCYQIPGEETVSTRISYVQVQEKYFPKIGDIAFHVKNTQELRINILSVQLMHVDSLKLSKKMELVSHADFPLFPISIREHVAIMK